MFNVGDRVKVLDVGKLYSTYDEFFDKFCPRFKEKYKRSTVKGEEGRIVFMHPHQNFDTILCVVGVSKGKAILMGQEGLEVQ